MGWWKEGVLGLEDRVTALAAFPTLAVTVSKNGPRCDTLSERWKSHFSAGLRSSPLMYAKILGLPHDTMTLVALSRSATLWIACRQCRCAVRVQQAARIAMSRQP